MALRPYKGFVGPAYTSTSRIADAERLVNLYPEQMESPGAQVAWALYPTPGMVLIGTSGKTSSFTVVPIGASVRGAIPIASQTYAPNGAILFMGDTSVFLYPGSAPVPATEIECVNESGTAMLMDANPASLAYSDVASNSVVVATGGKGYTMEIGTGNVTQVLSDAVFVGFLDGFFLALTSAGVFQISNLLDATTWDPTQVLSRTAAGDPWISLLVVGSYIWLFGNRSTDIYYDAGTAPFPFQLQAGSTIPAGVHAPYSPAVMDNTVFWLANTAAGGPFVYRAEGLIPKRVSTYAIENKMASYPTTTDARGWCYAQKGHSFYVLHFPSADKTWVYDAATALWHERADWNSDLGQEIAWRAEWAGSVGGVPYVGDRATGALYTLALDTMTDVFGNGIRRVRRFPHVSSNRQRMFYNRLELLIDAGLGTNSGQGSDPQLMLRCSNDGSYTWGPEQWRSAGKQGEYAHRVFWAPVGSARDRVFEMVQSDPAPSRWLDAYLDVTVGVS